MPMISIEDPRLDFVSIEKATTPIGGRPFVYTNRWWIASPDKTKILFLRPFKGTTGYAHAQCNEIRAIAESIRSRLYPWAELIYLECVYVPS